MPGERIQAEKILQPSQLFAAFLVTLVVLESAILTAAKYIEKPDWGAGVLVITAVSIVPVFLAAPVIVLKSVRGELLEGKLWVEWSQRIAAVASDKVALKFNDLDSFLEETHVLDKADTNLLRERGERIRSFKTAPFVVGLTKEDCQWRTLLRCLCPHRIPPDLGRIPLFQRDSSSGKKRQDDDGAAVRLPDADVSRALSDHPALGAGQVRIGRGA